MQSTGGAGTVLSTLLRWPGRLVYELHRPGALKRIDVPLAIVAVACLAAYGLVVGSFSGGEQFWAAPLKITLGSFAAAAICLPSLYVFSCLAGANDRMHFGALTGVLLAAVTVNALLLVSFAPVAWLFSESTESIGLIGTLHLIFWLTGIVFAMRLLKLAASYLGVGDRGYLLLWMGIFLLVNLQMTTTLRPLLGRSEHFLPTEKRFFLSHWADVLNISAKKSQRVTYP
jgi:hypothetical protein